MPVNVLSRKRIECKVQRNAHKWLGKWNALYREWVEVMATPECKSNLEQGLRS